ncbi:MAG: family 10 glycosylhydrolase, partial [Phycisphaerae bacterium]|nr:family 10 glycosylhydrolase [Phycisphaerae bacterium]
MPHLCHFSRTAFVASVACLFAAVPLTAAEVIVDNTDAGFSVLSGTWSTRTAASGEYGANYARARTATSASGQVQWQPTIPTAGDYEVFVWYPSGDGTHITDARYRVYYNGGNQAVTINQTTNFSQWVSLGTYNFAAGSSTDGRVTLTNQAGTRNLYVFADAVRFYNTEPVNLTMAASPGGAGSTSPTIGGPYTYNQGEVVNISATPAGNYAFSHWTVSAGSQVANPTSASTTVTMDVTKTVTAVFVPISLTMAVSPPGAGTTVPAVGGPYNKNLNEVVSISATENGGYTFSHWTVSAGSAVADPNSPSTTVTMDTAKTVTAVFTTPTPPEFRAFWADVFHYGLQTASQVDQMIALAVQGNYNVIIPEVLAFHDNQVGSHGAYWRSNIVARSTYVTESFDPLAYMCEQAHANGLELHPWLVAFRCSSVWPPVGNAYLAAHPEWLKVPKAAIGTIAPVGSYYEFDPGSPDVQDYLASVVRELLTDYPIDGIHWDYIRSTNPDSGYPSDLNYANSGLKRFQRIYNRSDVPNATGDAQWDDFRRRSITELVRRIRWEIPLITSNPRQPVRHSASVVTWYPCSTNFHNTRPYYEVFSDWEYWQSEGYLDSPVLMAYFDEDGSYDQTYRDWVNNTINLWRYNRQVVIGPGIYMNSFANSVIQLLYARNAGADGLSTYSYGTTNDTGTTWTDWYPYVAANLFTAPAPVPSMPWRNPATATEGTLYGRVTDAGVPVDDATVQVGALPTIQTDGGGYYVVTQIPATAGGTNYSVTASKTGYTPVTHSSVQVVAGDVRRDDLDFSSSCVSPSITAQPVAQNVCAGTNASFTVAATGDAPLSYQWQKNQVDLSDGGHYSGVTTTTLAITGADAGDVASYRCVVTNACGSATSNEAALTLKAATVITEQPELQNVCPGATAVFTVAAT